MSKGTDMANQLAGAQAPANSVTPQGKSVAAAIIGAVGALASAGISGVAAYRANRRNEALMHEQNQWNLSQWMRENAYNLPTSQIARLKAAGLNPSLIYGQGGIMNESANSQPAADAPTMRPELTIDPLTASQISKNEAEAEAIRHTTKREDEKQPLNLETLQTSINQSLATIDQYRELLDGIKSDNRKKRIEAFVAENTVDDAIQIFKDNAAIKHYEARYYVLNLLSHIGLMESEEELNRAKVGLTDSQKKNIDNLTFVTYEMYKWDKAKFDAIQPYLKQNANYQSWQEFYKAANGMVDYNTAQAMFHLIETYGDAEKVLELIKLGTESLKNGADAVSDFLPRPRTRY